MRRLPGVRVSSRLLRVVGVAVIAALAFAAGSLFTALGSPAPATYSACVAASSFRTGLFFPGAVNNGTLYNVTVNGTPRCNRGDTVITWNQEGPMGPSGPAGPAGAPRDCNLDNIYPGVNLAECKLSDIPPTPDLNLTGANLGGAILDNSEIPGANLTGADLAGASLGPTNLNGANLTGANLGGADLNGGNFSNANLTGANLKGDVLIGVTFNNTTCPDRTNSDNDGDTCAGHL